MSSSSLLSMRIILFSVLAPQAIQAFVERLEALEQQVMLLVVSPGTNSHAIEHYPQIVASAPRGLDVLVARHMQRLPDLLSGLAPDLILVAGFPRKFPLTLVKLPKLGCINWHPSLLPRYRGPEPLFWQFMHGETHMGMTFHRMDADIDTGPILVQRAIELAPEDDITSLFPKLLDLTLEALPEVLQALAARIPGTPQSAKEGTYAPHVTDAERWLDWTHPATQLHNQVRVWGNIGGIRTEVEGRRLIVGRARVIDHPPSPLAKPGSLLKSSSEGIVIQTGQGALLLQNYRMEAKEGTAVAADTQQNNTAHA